MANALYDIAREGFLKATLDIDNDTRVILIDTSAYTKNLATDDFRSDIAGGAQIATSGALGSKTTSAGVLDAADVTWTAVSGAVSEEVVGYYHSGSGATDALIWDMDTFGSGMPVTPNGGNISISWNASGIFKL